LERVRRADGTGLVEELKELGRSFPRFLCPADSLSFQDIQDLGLALVLESGTEDERVEQRK